MNTLLFDLDGTILPIDYDAFEKHYFTALSAAFHEHLSPKDLLGHVWTATKETVMDLSPRKNKEVFLGHFESLSGINGADAEKLFYDFYENGFDQMEKLVIQEEKILKAISIAKEKGYRIVVATNPIFPELAIHKRLRWAGLSPEEVSYITTFENSSSCKPQPAYYKEILRHIGISPEEAMMVGNDEKEDAIAEKLGIKTYIIENYLISREDAIPTSYRGSYDDFLQFVKDLPNKNDAS